MSLIGRYVRVFSVKRRQRRQLRERERHDGDHVQRHHGFGHNTRAGAQFGDLVALVPASSAGSSTSTTASVHGFTLYGSTRRTRSRCRSRASVMARERALRRSKGLLPVAPLFPIPRRHRRVVPSGPLFKGLAVRRRWVSVFLPLESVSTASDRIDATGKCPKTFTRPVTQERLPAAAVVRADIGAAESVRARLQFLSVPFGTASAGKTGVRQPADISMVMSPASSERVWHGYGISRDCCRTK